MIIGHSRRRVLGYGAAGVAALGMPSIARAQGAGRAHRAADQDLLSDHHRRDGGAPEAVREGRHQGGADDLSRRRRRLRGDGGGRRRRDPQFGLLGRGRHQEGRDGEERRRRGARLLRLAPGGEARLADQGRQGPRRQEGRHHVGRLGHRHSRTVDAGRPQDHLHPRAARRRRAGAEPALRQHRRDGDLLAAHLQAVHREDRRAA